MPTPAAGSVAWRRRDTTLSRRTPRAVLILPEHADEPLRLDGPAAAVWHELDAPRTDLELVDRVAARIGTTTAEVGGDVITTRTALALIGAVTEVR
jgi:hypothetical protein